MTPETDLLGEKFAKERRALKQFDEVSKDDPAEIAARIRVNQDELAANLGGQFDFIVCGAGTSGLSLGGSRRTPW